jgi:hypothetical protein
VQALVQIRRVRTDGAARDPHIGDREGETVAFGEGERRIEGAVVLVGDDEQARQSGVDLLGGDAVGVRVKPVQPRAVFHLEAHALAGARGDGVEAGTVLRFGQREAVEVHRGGLGQGILDRGIEGLAAARPEDGLGDSPRPEVGNVAASSGKGVRPFDDQAANVR